MIRQNKAGVSLVAVLLFMLVATIAATATYKWLTSEGRSSSARLQKQSAYQSSIAGIENARSWMTYHANDVGALIKAYIDGGNKPVNIDARLRTLQRPGQNYHVWLTGVNTESSTYKLKILSSGEANGGAKHSEIAIFNVDGLYRVEIPVEQHHATTDFEYAYFGGGVEGTGTTYESAVINGNWGANPPSTNKNWIVTGNASLSGSMINVGKTSCIGGNLNANNGVTSKDLFVGGDITGTALRVNVTQDAYIGGNMVVGDQPVSIGRHLTMLGKIKTKPQASQFSVGGNLCAGENATLVHDRGAASRQTYVKGNVWMPGAYNIWHKDINCTKTIRKYCKCDNNGFQINCDEFGKINIYDQTQYKVKSCTEYETTYNFNDQNQGNGPRYHCKEFQLKAPVPADNYNFGDFPGDNYKNYEYLWASGKEQRGFLLGEESGSKVYVKSGRSWTDLNAKATSKYTEKTDHPRQCLGGYPVWGSALKTCGNNAGNNPTHYKSWSDEQYSPYADYVAAKTNKPSSLYYIYYMPEGVKDVDFGTYSDSYWKWCYKSAGGYCQAWNDDTELYGYFVNAPMNSKQYVFTNSGHSNDADHPVKVTSGTENRYYRYLNMSNTGGEILGSPWCKKANGKEWRPVCGVGPWFASNGDVIHDLPAEGKPFECAEPVKETCDAIWLNEPGCDAASYKVPDALVTAKAAFEPYANKGCAKNITTWNSSMVDALNSCYNDHKNDADYVKENFYNGYVVVKVSGSGGTGFSGTLNGKFVIIATDRINAQNGIITASEDSYVLLYLEKGAKYLQGTANNLFIYSTGKFTETSKLHLTGTVYTPSDSCIRIRFEDAALNYSPELVSALTSAAIICNNDGSPCGGTASPTSSASVTSSASGSTVGGYDRHYTSMAPQLGVTLESQYENNEPIPSGDDSQTNLSPSFIVLPRIIYLPNDPYGYLSDYYSVLPLNGSSITKDDLTSVSCPLMTNSSTELHVSSKLYDGTALAQGIYKCTAKANNHPDIDFWVKVGASKRGAPTVSFLEPSQEMPVTGTKEVHISVGPHAEAITVKTTCPAAPDGWTYLPEAGEDNMCTFEIPANTESEEIKLFDVSTSDASNGTLSFVLQAGEGYTIGNAYAELHVSSTATLKREDVTPAEIQSYCSEHPNTCPSETAGWPKMGCDNSGAIWVQPTGSYGDITPNYNWSVPVGGSGTVTLEAQTVDGCVVIVPSSNNSYVRSSMESDHEYTLRASVFAEKKTLRVGFVGDPGTGNDPHIIATVGARGDKDCYYSGASGSPRYCTIDVFMGEAVTLTVEDNSASAKFNYWQCASDNCPDREPLPNKNYGTFTVSGNFDYVAHFGESDKHCFFDEFKDGSGSSRYNRADVKCLDESTEYCIDYCGSTCPTAATDKNVKWRLLRGAIGDITYAQSYGYISAKGSVNKGKKDSNRNGIVVMSTVNAGVEGTMKALVQLPRASAHGYESRAIRNSGFILHSNSAASEYLMLNLYVNSSGNLEAQVCRYNNDEYSNCQRQELKDGYSGSASVDISSMIMASAELNGTNLNVSAFTGNYYSDSPRHYACQFDVSAFDYNDRTHEYVGFSLADQNFKIHGIGWKSVDYNAECHDTYPVVKCSFAAVAKGGIVKTDTNITPWVGHSGWFDRASYSCTESYYYYNGSDAGCGTAGNDGSSCGSYYRFNKSGAGAHGYKSGALDMKTAKAWLDCSTSDPDAAPWTVASEAERAHCGYFWTGEYKECANDANLVSSGNLASSISGNTAQSFAFSGATNLRKAKLNVTLENDDGNEVEIWLYSENNGEGCWGGCDPFESQSVRMFSNSETFDVASVFVGDSSGFNPEKVTGIMVKNYGSSYITVQSVVSSCDNAIGITGCSASFSSGNWTITANLKNKKNVESVTYTAKVDGELQFSETKDCKAEVCLGEENTFTFQQADNPYEKNQDKYYTFMVSITGNGGQSSYTFESCDPVVPSPIGSLKASCEMLGAKPGTPPTVEQGKGLPTFKATFLGDCPSGGCSYRMTLDDTEFITGSETGSVSHTPSGNTETAFDVNSEHTLKLISTDSEHPFTPGESCTQTFKVVEKELDPVGLTCNISIANPSVSSTRTIDKAQVTATNCESGCTYTITEGSATVVSSTAYDEDADISFTSASEAGAHTYTLTVIRTKDSKTATCTFSETYPLNVTCDIAAVGSVSDPWDPSTAVSVSPSAVSGCNSNCSYTITGGVLPSPNSGANYNSGEVSFVDNVARGTKNYTLTIAHGLGVSAQSAQCPFTVTYTPEGSGCNCTCSAGCDDLQSGSVSQDPNTAVKCFFGTEITAINENYSQNAIMVNGKRPGYCYDAASCNTALANAGVQKLDGGYYVEMPVSTGCWNDSRNETCTWIMVNVGGSTTPVCQGTIISSSSTALSSAVVSSSSTASSISAACEWDPTTTYISKNANFKASNFSVSNRNIHFVLYDADDNEKDATYQTSDFWSNNTFTSQSFAFSSSGEYKYTLKDGNGSKICDATLSVNVPTAACAVSENSIVRGDPVTFSVPTTGWTPNDISYTDLALYYGSGTTPIKTWNNVYGNNTISFDYNPTASGAFTLKGFDDGETLCTTENVTVTNPKPTCTVANMTKTAGSAVQIPVSSTGCTTGACTYTVTGGTKGGTSGSGYYDADGVLGTTITGEAASTTPVQYTLTLTDGNSETGTCTFNVTYTSSSPSVNGTVCLAGRIDANIPAGTYTFKSRCPSGGWGYICTSGYSITFGSTSFACKGDEVNTYYTQGVSNMNTAPVSGTLTVPSGASITVLWCQGDNGQMPEGCTSSGYFPND